MKTVILEKISKRDKEILRNCYFYLIDDVRNKRIVLSVYEYSLGGYIGNFINKRYFLYSDKIEWSYICFSQHLSESFIRRFKNQVDWKHFKNRKDFSKKFKEEFKEKLQ